jgi:PAS domain S-box-containing protein
MSHKQKISSSNKSVYILILSTGVFIALAVFYSLYMGIRINFLYSTLLDASLKIKLNLVLAQSEVLNYTNDPSEKRMMDAMQYLSLVEFNSKLIIEEKDRSFLFSASVNNSALNNAVQNLQVELLQFRDLSSKFAAHDSSVIQFSIKSAWENSFRRVVVYSSTIENQLRTIISARTNMFRLTQLGLMALSILLAITALTFFYRYEKQRDYYVKKIEETTQNIEKGNRKRTRTEEAFIETQRKLNTLIQNLPGMVYRSKADQLWAFDYVSDMCMQVTGYKAEDLINNNKLCYYDLIHTDDKKKIYDLVKVAIEEKKPFQLIYRIYTAAGYEKWVWEQGVGVFSEKEDELLALEGFIVDITEQKTVEEQVNLQSYALEAAANGIVITDKEGIVLWANSSFTNLTGYTLKEALGKKLNILKSGYHDESYYSFMWEKINSGQTWRGEIINKRKDGTLYNEEMTITPTRNPSGEVISFVAVKQDITERKLSEQALKESEMRFRGLFENATIGIYQTSVDGKILMVNPTLLKISGYRSLDEMAKRPTNEFYADMERYTQFKREITQNGFVVGFESLWFKKDGTPIYIRESARAVTDDEGRITGYEGTIEDISEKKKTEEALIEAKERAELSDRLKSEFLAQISHEIRTPLNVILSFTSLMKEELQSQVDEEMADAFDVIDSEGKRIMRTVELILNMSELQTGSYSYRPKTIDLAGEVIRKIYNGFQQIAKKKNVALLFINNTDNAVIEADEYSINQIFYHLIDNALKYTSEGKVEIALNRDVRDSLYVDVSDTGIGISQEYLPMLFTPFTREEKGYTRTFEGNGLGLALVKRYCELNNAEIKVSSIKGQGTTFRVIFPS